MPEPALSPTHPPFLSAQRLTLLAVLCAGSMGLAAGVMVGSRLIKTPAPQVVVIPAPPAAPECPAPRSVISPPSPAEPMMWASQVRARSSEYTESSWSARMTLGTPDVFPSAGDNVSAWAPLGADDGIESIEVMFPRASPADAIDVFETYNPGAVKRIEVLTEDREWVTMFEQFEGPAPTDGQSSMRRRIEFGCSNVRYQGARVTLDTRWVSGWNEIDAIGLRTCDP